MPEINASALHVQVPFSKRIRSAVGLWSIQFNVARRWSRVEANPAQPDPLLPVRLYGIVGTWCEEDVIQATVSNAFAQGCERVFIVDNKSQDNTLERAAAAGAEIARAYHTDYYDERRRLAEMTGVINAVSPEVDADHVWWLLADADEFVHGPAGLPIIDYLAGLDRRFRVVGARVFNHFPTGDPANVPDRHPLDYQPMCQELRMAWCSLGHWKHPLIRWDRSGPEIRLDTGFHRVRAPVRVGEPREGVFMHHFQYRNRPQTYERLRRLCEAQEDGVVRSARQDATVRGWSGVRLRWATLDYVYAQDWVHVNWPTPRGHRAGVNPRPWTSLVSAADASVARWYATEKAKSAL
jgi:hypothetical protein